MLEMVNQALLENISPMVCAGLDGRTFVAYGWSNVG